MNTPERMLNHPVFFDETGISHLSSFLKYHVKPRESIFVLTDENTNKHCLELFESKLHPEFAASVIEIPSGEKNKTIETCSIVWNSLTRNLADRQSILINLGGGVVCDVGGFVAAVFKRGIRFMHMPTSLMAMADASIGGKNGVDFLGLKNILGTFTQPMAVFIDPRFLDTLPEREMNNGFAEMLKHGLVSEYSFFEQLVEKGFENLTSEDIRISAEIKSDIVQRDPFEKGIRKVLNFGHTVGHALESYSLLHDERPLLHGEAIVLGMMAEVLLSEKHKLITPTETEPILAGLFEFAVLYDFNNHCIESMIEFMANDKKSQAGIPGFSLMRKPGQIVTGYECNREEIVEALKELNDIFRDN
ncbi:MAG TPA: 3-dehydroquinate synthase [Bacteroidales bacterium]|nr:3-dehydroquinate synthase [Bacteroidales bacterium]